MTFRIELTVSALSDIDNAHQWLAERTVYADAWFGGLHDAINRLARLPDRCPLARESPEFGEPIRQLLYGDSPHLYRVLFLVRLDVVYVLHVRHGARRAMPPDDIALSMDAAAPH